MSAAEKNCGALFVVLHVTILLFYMLLCHSNKLYCKKLS